MTSGVQDYQHPINYTALQDLEENVAAGVAEVIVELIDTYIDDSHQTFDVLSQALSESNVKQVELSAHTLKSSSATFGAEALSALFAQIEQLARNGNTDTISDLLPDARQKFSDVELALLQERQRVTSI